MRKVRRKSEQSRWTRDRDKESYWRAQVALWEKSGLSVRAFCKEQGVIETSFYAWRRELLVRARETNADVLQRAPSNKTSFSVKDSRGPNIPAQFRESEKPISTNGEATNLFVPLTIVQPNSIRRTDLVTAAGLTLTTPCGFRILISSVEDLDLLEKILPVLESNQC